MHAPGELWSYLRFMVNQKLLLPSLATASWEQSITLQAYVVNLADPAAPGRQGVLQPLLTRLRMGATALQVFGLPAVQVRLTCLTAHVHLCNHQRCLTML